MIERSRDHLISAGVEAHRNDLSTVSTESAYFAARFDIPQFSSVVHAARGEQSTLRIERQADNLGVVALERVKALAAVRAPQLTGLVERTGRYLVSVGVVEADRVDYVSMSFESV